MKEYIRIDEAIKKYAKTRQTFYNYINKWLLQTKKINNRIFINTDSIEKLIQSTLQEDQFTNNQIINKEDNNLYNQFEEMLDTTLLIKKDITVNNEHLKQYVWNTLHQLWEQMQTITQQLKSNKQIENNEYIHHIQQQNAESIQHQKHHDQKIMQVLHWIRMMQIIQKKMFIYFTSGIAILFSILYWGL
jgi:hypothetical protein